MKQRHPLKDHHKKDVAFCLKVPAVDCCLLPTPARKRKVPSGKGGMGQSNVRYCFDPRGRRITRPWMERIAEYIESYAGRNLLEDQGAEAEDNAAAEIVIETSAGFETN